jgi:hypothetical protein
MMIFLNFKKGILLSSVFSLLTSAFFVSCNDKKDNGPTGEKTTVHWSEMIFDFGNVKKGSKSTHIFVFENTGKVPYSIDDAHGSCGCTIVDFAKEPVQPGEKGKITVTFSADRDLNMQEKIVTIIANTQPVQTILKIRAFIHK